MKLSTLLVGATIGYFVAHFRYEAKWNELKFQTAATIINNLEKEEKVDE